MSNFSSVAELGHRPEVMVTVSVIFLALTWTAVTLRVFVRSHLIHSFSWDDWSMLVTLLLFTGQCSCLITVARMEMSQKLKYAASHSLTEEVAIVSEIIKFILSTLAFYLWVTVVLKISLAIFFLRVITVQWHRKVVYIATSIYTIFAVGFAFVGIFQCGNPANFIITWVGDGCMSDDILQPLNYLAAGLNAMIDWIFVLFPLHVVRKSQMARSSKISACILLLMGSMGSVASLIRIKYIPGLRTTPDFFSKSIDIAVWSVVEPGIGIFTVSLATLRPLFRSAFNTSRSTARSFRCPIKNRSGSEGNSSGSRGLDFQDRGDHVEGNWKPGIAGPTNEKMPTTLQEMGYDMNKVSSLGDMSDCICDTIPSSPPPPPVRHNSHARLSIPPRDWSTISSESVGHFRAPSQAFVKDGKVVLVESGVDEMNADT